MPDLDFKLFVWNKLQNSGDLVEMSRPTYLKQIKINEKLENLRMK
jgi:hypothetical protein